MNGIFALVFAGTILGAFVLIPWARRYDMVMAELEALDDESLAEAWERSQS